MKPSGKLVTALIVGTLVYVGAVTAIRMLLGEGLRDSTLAAACWITGCAAPGVAFLGWLMIMTLPLLIIASVVAVRRYGRRGGIGATVAGLVYFALAMCFVPGRRGPDLADMLRGAGTEPFVSGMMWGYGSVAVAAALSITFAALSAKLSWGPAVPLGIVVLAMLGMMTAAMVRAPAAYPPAVVMIGPSTTVGDDILTRGAVTDRDGCDDIPAVPESPRGCLHTAEFQLTTSDSDALILFSAVMFADNEAAWEARRGIRGKTSDGTALVLSEVTRHWLTVAEVRHIDGRPIAAADEPWMRWPAEQVQYAFEQGIGYSLATEPKPDAEAAPKD